MALIDTFEKKIPLKIKDIVVAKRKNLKLSLVSPELLTNNKRCKKFYTRNIKLIKKIDNVCTKFPEYWESIIINE